MTSRNRTRRQVLQTMALTATWLVGRGSRAARLSPNDKLNLACIGAGGRGAANLDAVKQENIVALCDVDEQRAGRTFDQYPHARKFQDFRRTLDQLDRQIDAVVVSPPDRSHAVVGVKATQMGKHCYCEKPLAHAVYAPYGGRFWWDFGTGETGNLVGRRGQPAEAIAPKPISGDTCRGTPRPIFTTTPAKIARPAAYSVGVARTKQRPAGCLTPASGAGIVTSDGMMHRVIA